MSEATATEEQTPAEAPADEVEVSEAQLPEAEPARVKSPGGQLDILLDSTMRIAIRLGHAEMPARELIQLGPGSVVTLDRRVGEPVELLLRGIPFALGKLVVVGEQLGVKIEEILSPDAEGE
ncbi:MAG TPA: FliM/FliN family flagellar motor switch protein [Phycisphaerae bacterium]|nr:FliM/FliN family flagellar motor switch protein [Phycisphaerae bacterium]